MMMNRIYILFQINYLNKLKIHQNIYNLKGFILIR
jgi:hypothetical protein